MHVYMLLLLLFKSEDLKKVLVLTNYFYKRTLYFSFLIHQHISSFNNSIFKPTPAPPSLNIVDLKSGDPKKGRRIVEICEGGLRNLGD